MTDFTEADADYYEIRRHDRMRARLWAEFARVVMPKLTELSKLHVGIAHDAAALADAALAEYDKRWPRQKEQEA